MHRKSARLHVLFVFLCTVAPVVAQQPAASAPGSTPAPAVHTISLDVVVTDKSGKPVGGLAEHDFSLLDNKRPASILSFRAVTANAPAAEPVQILLLIDEVNAPFQRVAFDRDAVTKFLKQNGGHLNHPVTLIFFSDSGSDVFESKSGDGNKLAADVSKHDTALRSIRRSQGIYGASDRLQISVSELSSIAKRAQSIPGRKLLLWISPGWPYLSGPNIVLSDKEEQNLFRSVIDISTALRRGQVTISSIDPIGAGENVFRSNYYEDFLKGVSKPQDVQLADLSLQVLAAQTGGRVLSGNNDVSKQIDTAMADAEVYYVVTIPMAAAEHPDEYHSLQVKAEQSGLTARTRTGYYAQP